MKEKLEITYKLIQQIKEQLKLQEGKDYKGLLSVAVYLINLWINEYYNNNEEYEFFTHYKAYALCIELMPWLAVADDRYQFGNKSFPFKKYLKEINIELDDIKYRIIQLWKKGALEDKLKRNKEKLGKVTNEFDKHILELYIEMTKNLTKRYPKCEPELFTEFVEDLNYVGKI